MMETTENQPNQPQADPREPISLHVRKAAAVGKAHVPNVTIVIAQSFPDAMTLEAATLLHKENAAALADALCRALPGGTLHRLIADLLTRSAKNWIIVDEAMANGATDR